MDEPETDPTAAAVLRAVESSIHGVGISAICAKLIHRGVFDAADINSIFDAMVGSIPKVSGAEEDAQRVVGRLEGHRGMLVAAAEKASVIE